MYRILWTQLYVLMTRMLFPSGIRRMHFNGNLSPVFKKKKEGQSARECVVALDLSFFKCL